MALEPKLPHHPDARGLGHLGVAPDALGITLVPLTERERHCARLGLNVVAGLAEISTDANLDWVNVNQVEATELRAVAALFKDDAYEPHDSPLAARFFQVRRERDEAVRMLAQANELLARYADSIETQVGR